MGLLKDKVAAFIMVLAIAFLLLVSMILSAVLSAVTAYFGYLLSSDWKLILPSFTTRSDTHRRLRFLSYFLVVDVRRGLPASSWLPQARCLEYGINNRLNRGRMHPLPCGRADCGIFPEIDSCGECRDDGSLTWLHTDVGRVFSGRTIRRTIVDSVWVAG